MHYFLSVVLDDYGKLSSVRNLSQQFLAQKSTVFNGTDIVSPPRDTPPLMFSSQRKANATFVFLCRNSDLGGAISSVQQMEDRFNKHHNYPWVFLNEEPFTDDFKR